MAFASSKIGGCFGAVAMAEAKDVHEDSSSISEVLFAGVTIITGLAIAISGGASAGGAFVICGIALY